MSPVLSLAEFLCIGLGVISGQLGDRGGSRRLAILGMAVVGLVVGMSICSIRTETVAIQVTLSGGAPRAT